MTEQKIERHEWHHVYTLASDPKQLVCLYCGKLIPNPNVDESYRAEYFNPGYCSVHEHEESGAPPLLPRTLTAERTQTQMADTVDMFADVLEFHLHKFAFIKDTPGIPDDKIMRLRENLVTEEAREFISALRRRHLPDLIDACADLVYVVLGTAVACGVDIRPVWNAIHASNMLKDPGVLRLDGKIMKPLGWIHPDVEAIITSLDPLQTQKEKE